MNEPIKPGDLVQIVRKFCTAHDDVGLGQIFTVGHISTAFDFWCQKCPRHQTILKNGEPLALGNVGNGDGYYPVSCLRRIPPLSELGDVLHHEEITA